MAASTKNMLNQHMPSHACKPLRNPRAKLLSSVRVKMSHGNGKPPATPKHTKADTLTWAIYLFR